MDTTYGGEANKMQQREKQKKTVYEDIAYIDRVLREYYNIFEALLALHIYLDGKYQVAITNWGRGMKLYNLQLGFNYEYLDKDSLLFNLGLMRAKLEGYAQGFYDSTHDHISNSHDVNVTVNNSVNITISIEEAKRKIDEMPGLTDVGSDEIKSKLDELERIFKEETPKKKRWEKIKPILAFAMDKGADVAIIFLELVLPKLLGM